MSKKTLDGLNYIVEAINNIVEPKVNSLKYDKTYRGKITQVISDNLYKVQINGVEYELPYSENLSVGQIVRVKAPLNNFSDIYIETLISQISNVSAMSLNNVDTFPLGYIYININNISPEKYFSGNWKYLGESNFINNQNFVFYIWIKYLSDNDAISLILNSNYNNLNYYGKIEKTEGSFYYINIFSGNNEKIETYKLNMYSGEITKL